MEYRRQKTEGGMGSAAASLLPDLCFLDSRAITSGVGEV